MVDSYLQLWVVYRVLWYSKYIIECHGINFSDEQIPFEPSLSNAKDAIEDCRKYTP